MTRQALGIRLVLRGKQVERRGVLGDFPFHELVEMTSRALLGAGELLVRRGSRLRRCGTLGLRPSRPRRHENIGHAEHRKQSENPWYDEWFRHLVFLLEV